MAIRTHLHTSKQRWKGLLLAAAGLIVAFTLWYSDDIAHRIREEEQRKVQLWSEAIQQRAELVKYTDQLFGQLKEEERKKADRLAEAYRIVSESPASMDLTFVVDYLWSNQTIPVLIYDRSGNLLFRVNVPDSVRADSLRDAMFLANPPIVYRDVGYVIYWSESLRVSELRKAMDGLIASFVSETVMNSASVPVVMTDSTRTQVIRFQRVDSTRVHDPTQLRALLREMESRNPPIAVDLPVEGRQYIYYADSVVLTQLRYFPIVQLTLIAVFLFVAYLIFSSFKRSEQNRVWAGMAKETAHQLGTPLSSLMAWTGLLEAEGVNPEYLQEMGKDIDRLHTVVDRFSKIGSEPELKSGPVGATVSATVDYMRPRISKQVRLTLHDASSGAHARMSPVLIGWVVENLIRNAVDAMEGTGAIDVGVVCTDAAVQIRVADTGKGIPKQRWKEVFAPGFTTKPRGWGLGLSLSKRIVETYHGGRISVETSTSGLGTTFLLELPKGITSESSGSAAPSA
jgi:signal transduction histidine kinase